MMKCTDIQKYLDDYLDDAMSLGEQKAVESHIEQCTSCKHAMDEHKNIREALSTLPVEKTSLDFEQKTFSEVRSHYGIGGGRYFGNRFTAGFATAMVASLALWFTSSMYLPQLDDSDSQQGQQLAMQVISVTTSKSRTVKLLFDAASDLADVTLIVQLPNNIEIEGYAGQKQLVWQTKLTKGQNVLALPVIAVGNGQGELVAQLHYGDKTQQFSVVLKTASDGALIYQIDKLKIA